MGKEDMMILISAWEGFFKLHFAFSNINGNGLDEDLYKGLWDIPNVIQRYSRFANAYDDESEDQFYCIMNNSDLSTEQKYNLLTIE